MDNSQLKHIQAIEEMDKLTMDGLKTFISTCSDPKLKQIASELYKTKFLTQISLNNHSAYDEGLKMADKIM